jgi:hypothetical protein
MSLRPLTFLAVGDVILGPNPEYYFSPTKRVLKTADVLLGQLEVPYTNRDASAVAQGRTPDVLGALVDSGFHIVSLAGNHLADAGLPGIKDTIAWLKKHDIAYVGAGFNLEEARRHVIIERDGTRFGFLDYNCVGPKETWATATKPGCAYLNIMNLTTRLLGDHLLFIRGRKPQPQMPCWMTYASCGFYAIFSLYPSIKASATHPSNWQPMNSRYLMLQSMPVQT